MEASLSRPFWRADLDGSRAPIERALAVEMPVAIEVNGLGYAVLMASLTDLADLAYGFLLTEMLIETAADIIDVDTHEIEGATIVRIGIRPESADRLAQRVRHRTSDASCGLCGVENFEQALRPLPHVTHRWKGDDSVIFAALSKLAAHQPLNGVTGAVHAAARCAIDGRIIDVRKDVGRHNAFDKLIGAMMRADQDWGGGFALLTSRCSYELVEKAALSGCGMLATISAPTDLAVRRANEAGLALRSLARPNALLASLP